MSISEHYDLEYKQCGMACPLLLRVRCHQACITGEFFEHNRRVPALFEHRFCQLHGCGKPNTLNCACLLRC